MKKTMIAAMLLLLPLGLQDPQDAKKKEPVAPQVGQAAPAFRLNDHTGRAVQIGGPARTWTVVAFYPKAATPG